MNVKLWFKDEKEVTYHSFGGMILTIPDCIPYLSILSTKSLKDLNWFIVCKVQEIVSMLAKEIIIVELRFVRLF